MKSLGHDGQILFDWHLKGSLYKAACEKVAKVGPNFFLQNCTLDDRNYTAVDAISDQPMKWL